MANRYWVGGTNDWNGAAGTKWALTSGGAGGQAVPTSSDDVFFDANSGAVTVTATAATTSCKNINFTGFTGTFTGSTSSLEVSGSWISGSGMTNNFSGGITFLGSGSETITSNGIMFNAGMTISASSGSITIQDNLALASSFTVSSGTFNANNFNVTALSVSSSNSLVRTITMGSGTWTINGNTTPLNLATSTNLTLNSGTSTIKLTGTYTADRTFQGGGNTFYNLWNATSGSFALIIAGTNTFNDFRIDAGRTVSFTNGTTQTVSSFTASGTAGNLVTVQSTSAGSAWTLSKSSGTVSVDYLSIKDSTATGGASWYAGANSTNVSGNTGWIFTAPPVPTGIVTNVSTMTNITIITF